MEHRTLGRTGREVSVVGLGTWQLGADWGEVSEADAREVLETSADAEGVTFYDTADVYGDGRSEQIVGRFLADHAGDGFTVATKMGRRVEQLPEHYTPENFRAWTDRSRRNLGVDTLDLVQLHCPPSATIDGDATYDALDALVEDGSDRGVRRQRRDRRPGPRRDRPAARRERADHPERAAAQAARAGPPRRGHRRRRDHRAGAAGLGPAVGEVRREHDVRRRRPPLLQPRRQRLRRRRDLLRRAVRRRPGRRRRLRRPRARPAGAGRHLRPRPRSPGSGSSRG